MAPLFRARAKLQLAFFHALSTVPTFQATIFLAWLCGWIGSDDNRILIWRFYFRDYRRKYNKISKIEIDNAIESFIDGSGA